MTERAIFGITVRVAVDRPDAVPVQRIADALQRVVDAWEDGRRPFSVEQMLDGARRATEFAATVVAHDVVREIKGPPPLSSDPEWWNAELQAVDGIVRATMVRPLEEDLTVAIVGFPTVKPTGVYRVICTESTAEGAPRDGYVLATRQTFDSYEAAEKYAEGINYSRSLRVVVEVERGSW